MLAVVATRSPQPLVAPLALSRVVEAQEVRVVLDKQQAQTVAEAVAEAQVVVLASAAPVVREEQPQPQAVVVEVVTVVVPMVQRTLA